ncbi:monovalent cation:proton antiporter family protein, partial [Chloroflexota bacterium]
ERGLTTKPYGQALLIAAVIADFATMLLVSVYVVVRTEGLSPQVLLVLLLFGAFLTVYRMAKLAHRRLPGLGFLDNLSEATAQIDVRGAFAVGLAFIALAQGLGVEMILGAFLGGALISLLGDRHGSDLRHRLDVIGFGFFLPMFFIMVGVRFDVRALLASPSGLLLLPVLVLLAYAVKVIPALVYRLGYSRREALAGGALLSSRLSLIIAVAAIGLQMGSIDAATNSALILVAIVTSTFSPLMFNGLVPAVSATRGKFVIVASGHESDLLAKRVADHGEQVTVVVPDSGHPLSDEKPGRLPDRTRGPVVMMGDTCDVELWESLDPDAIQAVAVLLPEDDANLDVCRLLRERVGIGSVVSLVHDATRTREFTALGIRVVNPSVSPVVELENLMLYPTVSSLMADLEDEHDVAEVWLNCAEMAGRPLKELDLSDGAMVILVRRNGDVIYPRGNTVLQLGDQLTLVGSLEAVRDLARRCR